jgi:hypothetical protein
VFAVQTPDECMARLGLSTTNAADIQFIYQGLKRLGAPRKIHVDQSELVTGVFPLPVVQNGTAVLMLRRANPVLVGAQTNRSGGTLDWTDVMRIETGWSVTECDLAIPLSP